MERITYIETHGNANKSQVEAIQLNVLVQSILNETSSDKANEIKIEANINDAEDGLLAAIPDVVNLDVRLVDLKTGGNPDAKDADVDDENNKENDPL